MTKESEAVIVTLVSQHDGQSTTFQYKGQLYNKQRAVYIRYTEQEYEQGQEEIRTLIRYKQGELSIVRRGAIHSEQLFIPNIQSAGVYRAQAITMQIKTKTYSLGLVQVARERQEKLEQTDKQMLERPELPFSLEWHYDLLVNEQVTGKFHMKLHIRKDV
ncbi:DUF1934 domain-containing protein [Paenibacillus yanchengensis]|uniref:DUF1934 domain-containing protein n=1 Tax=Paenibacillus yanchengensis TaxID=2035833 RepID=A0ABW4YP56_9BACL